VILYVWAGLFGLAIGFLFAAALLESSGLRARDIIVLESRARIARMCVAASLVCLILVVLIGSPLIGAALAVVAVVWVLWWTPRSHRLLPLRAQAVIAAPPDSVAAVMFDVSAQPRWIESVLSCVNETPGLLRIGSVLRQTVRVQGRDLRARLRVAAYEPGRRLVLELLVKDGLIAEVFEIAPHERGSVVTSAGTHELTLTGAALSGWRIAGLKRSFNARRAANLERLRVLVERVGAPLRA
jgi:Polyketide cyclase / dehydrase and lipid transport